MGSNVDCAILWLPRGRAAPKGDGGQKLSCMVGVLWGGGGKAEPAKTEALVGVGSGGAPMQLDLSL